MRPVINPLSVEELAAVLRLDSETGKLYWRSRPGKTQFNSHFADKEAGTILEGYVSIKVGPSRVWGHRAVYALVHGHWPDGYIDHINQDRSDNRPSNLRVVDVVGNSRNRSLNSNNKSGVAGVRYYPRSKRWLARISDAGRIVHLGYFKNIEDAIAARKSAERLHHYHENHGSVRPGESSL